MSFNITNSLYDSFSPIYSPTSDGFDFFAEEENPTPEKTEVQSQEPLSQPLSQFSYPIPSRFVDPYDIQALLIDTGWTSPELVDRISLYLNENYNEYLVLDWVEENKVPSAEIQEALQKIIENTVGWDRIQRIKQYLFVVSHRPVGYGELQALLVITNWTGAQLIEKLGGAPPIHILNDWLRNLPIPLSFQVKLLAIIAEDKTIGWNLIQETKQNLPPSPPPPLDAYDIQAILIVKNWQLKELAEQLNVGQPTAAQWSSGDRISRKYWPSLQKIMDTIDATQLQIIQHKLRNGADWKEMRRIMPQIDKDIS